MKDVNPVSSRRADDVAGVTNIGVGFNLIGGGVAWLLHLLLAYLIAEFGCLRGWGDLHLMGITLVAWLVLFISVLTLGLAGVAIFISWRTGAKLRSVPGDGEDIGARAKGFTARAGLITNGLFFFVILVESIPILYFLRVC